MSNRRPNKRPDPQWLADSAGAAYGHVATLPRGGAPCENACLAAEIGHYAFDSCQFGQTFYGSALYSPFYNTYVEPVGLAANPSLVWSETAGSPPRAPRGPNSPLGSADAMKYPTWKGKRLFNIHMHNKAGPRNRDFTFQVGVAAKSNHVHISFRCM